MGIHATIHTNAHYAGGVNNYLNKKHTADFFCVFENFDRKFANPVAPPTDRTAKCFVRCKAHLVVLQTAKRASKSMHNWRRYPSSYWYKIDQKCGSKFWRFALAPSDATEKNNNIGSQLHSLLLFTENVEVQRDSGSHYRPYASHTISLKRDDSLLEKTPQNGIGIFKKIYLIYDFGVHKLVRSEPFLDSRYEI